MRTVDWDRTLDLAIVRVSANAPVPLAEITKEIERWLEDAGIDKDQFRVENANNPTRNVVVSFTGTSYIADQLVGKALASIPKPTTPTTYKEFFITTQPNEVAKLYFSRDKNQRQNAEESKLRYLRQAIAESLPPILLDPVCDQLG